MSIPLDDLLPDNEGLHIPPSTLQELCNPDSAFWSSTAALWRFRGLLKDIPQEDYLRFSLGYECAMFEVCLIIGYAFQNTWSVHNQDRLVVQQIIYHQSLMHVHHAKVKVDYTMVMEQYMYALLVMDQV